MASNEEGTKINESAYYEVRPAAGKDADVAEVQATMRDMKQAEFVPKPEDAMDALGIPDWRQLEKKVVRRLDMTLMPCLWGLYLFNYLDRASIAQARISTLDEDLGLEDYQYSTAVTILSVGYVIGQIPSNMIIGKVRPSVYLCCAAIVWSGVSAATVGANNYQGLVAVRFFLGLVEAPLFPGAIYLLGCWHTRKEVALRVAILYTGQTLAFCCAGLIAAGVFANLTGVAGLAGNGSSSSWPFAVPSLE